MKKDYREQIEEKLNQLPSRPGVYLMKNETEDIIYVGKAKSLRNRVRSYFRENKQSYKTQIMKNHITDFDYIVTDTEVEAYILEANLIKKYQPKFNIRLKDDKSYPYIKVTVKEDFPRIFKTRIVKKDGNKYFGPFANVDAIYKTINIIKDIFSLRRCKKDLEENNPEERPCLNYHIDKCQGPCIGEIGSEKYKSLIDKVCLFLSGNQEELIDIVEEKMHQAAEEKNFEKAARFRDALESFEEIAKQQKVMSDENIDQDVVALIESENNNFCVQLLLVRNGRLIGQEYFVMEGTEEESQKTVMASFMQQYYQQAPQIPDEILINTEFEQNDLLADRFRKKKNKKVKIKKPIKGNKKRLIEMGERNARENIKKEEIRQKYEDKRTVNAIQKLESHLNLDIKPRHIEGFDISNIQGTNSVASLVVFKDGEPSKKDYRRFKIKTVEGTDDYAMMQEVVNRRYTRLLEEDRKLPDLILIDGGAGQLNAAREILMELGLDDQNIISLAKKEEKIFTTTSDQPLNLPDHSGALQLLQRVRDEAHRFAVNYHRKLRSRRLTHSMLDDIDGVGSKRRQALLQYFGSLEKIKKAKISDLKQVEGISDNTAQNIYNYLRENTRVY